MTIKEFRAHKYLPTQWRKEMSTNGILNAVIEVLETEHPSRFAVHTDIQDDLSPTKAALELGFTRGYSAVLNTIRILAQPLKTIADVGEPTYAPEPKEETYAS
jgi:hypothetical protein